MKPTHEAATVYVAGQTFVCHPGRYLHWVERNAVVCTDLHLGKDHHFVKSGQYLPRLVTDQDLCRLADAIAQTGADTLYILGDLFHSEANESLMQFADWLRAHEGVAVHLVAGNHDVVGFATLASLGMKVSKELEVGPFLLKHYPDASRGHYVLAGHLHPGVAMRGKGRQQVVLPCFHFGQGIGTLPAFGSFTGLAKLAPTADDAVVAIAGREALLVSAGNRVAKPIPNENTAEGTSAVGVKGEKP